jgi:hypothetical protein
MEVTTPKSIFQTPLPLSSILTSLERKQSNVTKATDLMQDSQVDDILSFSAKDSSWNITENPVCVGIIARS